MADTDPTSADLWGLLTDAAALGCLPPELAEWSHTTRCWRFSPKLTAKTANKWLRARQLYLHRTPDTVAAFTHGWCEAQQPERGDQIRRVVAAWCRAATPNALSADVYTFAGWCTSPNASPAETALRWQVLNEWYALLTANGYDHTNPSAATRLAVVIDDRVDATQWLAQPKTAS